MNSDNDLQIAGDLLEVQHLLQPAREHPVTVAEFVGLARSIAADRAQWAPLVQYDATSRWYHRLRTGPGYEVWLLSWVPGQGTGTHDHGRSSGVLTVLAGELTERSENNSERLSKKHSVKGTEEGARRHSAKSAGETEGTEERSGAFPGVRPEGRPKSRSHVLTPGAQRVFAPGYVHEVVNDSIEPAVSLHIYYPGLTEMPMHSARCAPTAQDVLPAR
ncbi:cysteine dioxygenase [Streptomyces hebeiensis]